MTSNAQPDKLQELDLAAFKLARRQSAPFVANIPGSKSYTNRALVLASQRMGRTEIAGALHCEDTELLATCLDAFGGLTVSKTETGFVVIRDQKVLTAPKAPVYVGGGGTPARLLIAFAVMAQGETVVDGNARLRERPMAHLLDALAAMGVRYECLGRPGCLPVKISGGPVAATQWQVEGSKSSQFLTSLLLLAAQQAQPVTITVPGALVSESYIEMTLQIMQDCGIRVEHENLRRFRVYPSAPAVDKIKIEVDASAMSYFLAAAALTKSTVVIPGINQASKQGDAGFAALMEQMGSKVTWHADRVEITGTGNLRGISTDMDRMPDTVLTLAVVASQAEGPTRVSNIANLKIKECDRIHAIAAELSRLGVDATGGDDYVRVVPGKSLRPALVETYNDHRVAMAFSLLGLIHDGIRIQDPKCVEKSFPDFWSELRRFVKHHNGHVEALATA